MKIKGVVTTLLFFLLSLTSLSANCLTCSDTLSTKIPSDKSSNVVWQKELPNNLVFKVIIGDDSLPLEKQHPDVFAALKLINKRYSDFYNLYDGEVLEEINQEGIGHSYIMLLKDNNDGGSILSTLTFHSIDSVSNHLSPIEAKFPGINFKPALSKSFEGAKFTVQNGSSRDLLKTMRELSSQFFKRYWGGPLNVPSSSFVYAYVKKESLVKLYKLLFSMDVLIKTSLTDGDKKTDCWILKVNMKQLLRL